MITLKKYKQNRRRYYLHGKLKKVVRLNSKTKQIGLTDAKIDALTENQAKYV